MATSIFIFLVCLFVFAYWFRYTCLLILSGDTKNDHARQIAIANQLGFIEAKHVLATERLMGKARSLDRLHHSLDRDYKLLTYLLEHAERYHPVTHPFEQHMLTLDYHLMRVGYCLLRKASMPLAKAALSERASILNHFANQMGERVARI